jgi:hypothetical protein
MVTPETLPPGAVVTPGVLLSVPSASSEAFLPETVESPRLLCNEDPTEAVIV